MYGANDCYCRTKNTLQNWTVSKTIKNYAYLAADGLGGGYSLGGGLKKLTPGLSSKTNTVSDF